MLAHVLVRDRPMMPDDVFSFLHNVFHLVDQPVVSKNDYGVRHLATSYIYRISSLIFDVFFNMVRTS